MKDIIELASLLDDLDRNHVATNRDVSVYSEAATAIRLLAANVGGGALHGELNMGNPNTSFLTDEEIDALQGSKLNRATPYLIRGVSQTQFSIARYYGGIKYNGVQFTYEPNTDELIRDDVLKFVMKLRKSKKKQ